MVHMVVQWATIYVRSLHQASCLWYIWLYNGLQYMSGHYTGPVVWGTHGCAMGYNICQVTTSGQSFGVHMATWLYNGLQYMLGHYTGPVVYGTYGCTMSYNICQVTTPGQLFRVHMAT